MILRVLFPLPSPREEEEESKQRSDAPVESAKGP